MSWDQGKFLDELRACVDRFDQQAAARLSDELVAHVQAGVRLDDGVGRKVLGTLRRKSYFDQMERIAEALHLTEQDDAQIRRQYAQALIDQGKTAGAMYVLEALIEKTANDPDENAEARGLCGRLYKQLYVNAVNPDPRATAVALNRRNLQRAMDAYLGVYRSAPAEHLWHGINAAALAARAARDGIPLKDGPDPVSLAGEILDTLARRKQLKPLDAWDLATGAEASLTRGEIDAALLWVAQYVQQAAADAFEIGSTLRQLEEVWGLTIATAPGSLLLPLLQSALLSRRGGRVDVAAGDVTSTIRRTEEVEAQVGPKMEKILGREGVVSLGWYKLGLERARAVAKVLDKAGDGYGTGFLMGGKDLAPRFGDEIVLLTNAHVVSDDPAVQAKHNSLDPDDATVTFEALDAAAGQSYRVRKVLWTSAPEQLDASVLQLDPPMPACALFPVAKRLPVVDGLQKVYVIGHPGGRTLSISLNDNLLLDWDERLIHYRAPTEGGSSGSPVFNQQWDLIGLHHAGGDSVAKLNGKQGTYPANEAVWIRRIIAALSDAGGGGGARR
jgi:S1-C subfamily serine protease